MRETVEVRELRKHYGQVRAVDGIAGRELFGDAWLGYVVLAVWAVGSFALLRWQLARREG